MPVLNHLTPQPHWWHPLIKKLAATPFGIWLLAGRLHRLDGLILRWSGNRTTLTALLTGLPTILLTSIGAKSEQARTNPLVAIPHREGLILVASNFGNTRHPAWYFNLLAHPQVEAAVGESRWQGTARLLAGEERAACWEAAAEAYPGYQLYERKAGEREIPVFLLALIVD